MFISRLTLMYNLKIQISSGLFLYLYFVQFEILRLVLFCLLLIRSYCCMLLGRFCIFHSLISRHWFVCIYDVCECLTICRFFCIEEDTLHTFHRVYEHEFINKIDQFFVARFSSLPALTINTISFFLHIILYALLYFINYRQ